MSIVPASCALQSSRHFLPWRIHLSFFNTTVTDLDVSRSGVVASCPRAPVLQSKLDPFMASAIRTLQAAAAPGSVRKANANQRDRWQWLSRTQWLRCTRIVVVHRFPRIAKTAQSGRSTCPSLKSSRGHCPNESHTVSTCNNYTGSHRPTTGAVEASSQRVNRNIPPMARVRASLYLVCQRYELPCCAGSVRHKRQPFARCSMGGEWNPGRPLALCTL